MEYRERTGESVAGGGCAVGKANEAEQTEPEYEYKKSPCANPSSCLPSVMNLQVRGWTQAEGWGRLEITRTMASAQGSDGS